MLRIGALIGLAKRLFILAKILMASSLMYLIFSHMLTAHILRIITIQLSHGSRRLIFCQPPHFPPHNSACSPAQMFLYPYQGPSRKMPQPTRQFSKKSRGDRLSCMGCPRGGNKLAPYDLDVGWLSACHPEESPVERASPEIYADSLPDILARFV